MDESKKFVLASSSPARRELLRQIGFAPDIIAAADINETPLPKEKPRALVLRLAEAKALKVAEQFPEEVVLAADTIVYCRGQIMGKPVNVEEARQFLQKLSGRRHKLFTGVCLVVNAHRKSVYTETVVKVKRLTSEEIETFISSNQWQGKAGGYSLRGAFAAFIEYISGTDSCIIGLPLNKTYNLLRQYLQQKIS
jgi:septum formation protein